MQGLVHSLFLPSPETAICDWDCLHCFLKKNIKSISGADCDKVGNSFNRKREGKNVSMVCDSSEAVHCDTVWPLGLPAEPLSSVGKLQQKVFKPQALLLTHDLNWPSRGFSVGSLARELPLTLLFWEAEFKVGFLWLRLFKKCLLECSWFTRLC